MKVLEHVLRAVLILSLLSLAVLTPLWLRQPVSAAQPTPTSEPTAPPVPAPTPAPEERYSDAREHLLRRELAEAGALFRELGEYRDSARWLHYCERHQSDRARENLIERAVVYFTPKHGQGVLYGGDKGLFYLPNETGAETQALVYLPGGSSLGIHSLNVEAVIEYVSVFAPDAVCFFAYESGFHVIEEHNRACWDAMEELLCLRSLVPHEIVVIGTSNGFYAAEQLALQLWDEEWLPVRTLVSLDTGEDWKWTELLLNDEQLQRLAQAGTRIELFEQRRFDTGREPIQQLLRAGLGVDLIECDNGDHDTITRYAFRLGVPSWALGEEALNEQQYKLTPLTLEE